VTSAIQPRRKHSPTTIEGLRFLCCPCRGVTLKTTGATQAVVVVGSFLSECSDSPVSRMQEERNETRSTEEFKRFACEDVKCD
jgi:hypothetical protein